MNSELPPHIVDQAVEWAVKLGSGQAAPDVLEACAAWRNQDPCHEQAWQAIGCIDQEFKRIPESMAELACQTLEHTPGQMQKLKTQRRAVKALFLAVLVIGLGFGLGYHTFLPPKPLIYQAHSTLKGQQITLPLPDNSRILLNTDSKIQIDFSARERKIHLASGEIFVETGKDQEGVGSKRPFWVETKNLRFEAVGTRFNIRISDKDTQLYVSEGQVDIYLKDSLDPDVRVSAGHTFSVGKDPGQRPVEQVLPPLVPDAWIQGTVVARQMPLNEFTMELSRYITGRIDTDASAADLSISGVFRIKNDKDRDNIFAALSQTLPVQIQKVGRAQYKIYLTPPKK